MVRSVSGGTIRRSQSKSTLQQSRTGLSNLCAHWNHATPARQLGPRSSTSAFWLWPSTGRIVVPEAANRVGLRHPFRTGRNSGRCTPAAVAHASRRWLVAVALHTVGYAYRHPREFQHGTTPEHGRDAVGWCTWVQVESAEARSPNVSRLLATSTVRHWIWSIYAHTLIRTLDVQHTLQLQHVARKAALGRSHEALKWDQS